MTVCLMLKAPIPGYCKTRLAAQLNDPVMAAAIYRRLVEKQAREIPPHLRTMIFFTPADAGPQMRSWLGDGPGYRQQSEGELGERLIAAMDEAFDSHAAPVMFLGGDCPMFQHRHFLETTRLIETHDVVIAPASDGGYCMLASRVREHGIFNSITWSTPTVLSETLHRCAEAGLSVARLEEMEDVDDLASFERTRRLFDSEGSE